MRRAILEYWKSQFLSLLVVCLLVPLSTSLMAQAPESGMLAGRITDSSGAAVANATVTATSAENGQTRSTRTREDGSYRLDSLPPGDYVLKIEGHGFKTLQILSATVTSAGTTIFGRETGTRTKRR